MPKYDQLSIDGIVGDVYDNEAVHNDQFVSVLGTSLTVASIKQVLLDLVYPIGSFFLSDSSTNPSAYLGGEWESVEGRFLIGASTLYPGGSTGGSPDAVVPAHTHGAAASIDSSGAHNHPVSGTAAAAGQHSHDTSRFPTYSGSIHNEKVGEIKGSTYKMVQTDGAWSGAHGTTAAGSHTHSVSGSASGGAHTHPVTITVSPAGVNGSGANLPPYKAVYIWVRTQ